MLTAEKADFLKLCLELLDKHGKDSEVVILGQEMPGKIYDDEIIYVASDNDRRFLEVERKKENVPIIFMDNGEAILFHRNYIFLIDHVKSLLNI